MLSDMSITERFFEMKRQGEPIAVLTAYDAPTARAQAAAGIDLILVGDSVGTNFLGYASEREVTLADIAHHVRAVRRGAPATPMIGDLPFATYDTPAEALANARALLAAGADMVKFEGARPAIARALREAGIPVCGHLGLEPQHHEEKRLKGKTAAAASQLLADARRWTRPASPADPRTDPRAGRRGRQPRGRRADDRHRRRPRHGRAGPGDHRRARLHRSRLPPQPALRRGRRGRPRGGGDLRAGRARTRLSRRRRIAFPMPKAEAGLLEAVFPDLASLAGEA